MFSIIGRSGLGRIDLAPEVREALPNGLVLAGQLVIGLNDVHDDNDGNEDHADDRRHLSEPTVNALSLLLTEEGTRTPPASLPFVPPVAGLIMAGEIIRAIAQKE